MDFHMGIAKIGQARRAFRFLKKSLSVYRRNKRRSVQKKEKQKSRKSFFVLPIQIDAFRKTGNIRKKIVGAGRILIHIRNRYL